MIVLDNASLRFGETTIFDSASLKIRRGQRLGICAPNGTGKTTLLRCIAGETELHGGSISKPHNLRLAYFRQEGGAQFGGQVVREALAAAFAEYWELGRKIAALEAKIAELSGKLGEMGAALDELERLHEQQSALGYEQREAAMAFMLKGLGFQPGDIERRCDEFSGGWQIKLALAQTLLQKPEMLLLDEPTNHLDLEARLWLIGALQKLNCTQMIISHDRYFLDHTIQSVAELKHGKIRVYAGNYSQYERERGKNIALLGKREQRRRSFVQKEEALIERFRYKASKARQMQSRAKLLEKMQKPDKKRDQTREETSEAGTQSIHLAIRLAFTQQRPSGYQVLELENTGKSYGSQAALERIHLSLQRGEKVALVGGNGAGKSTLLRLIAKTDAKYSGKIRWGPNVQLAYFSQSAAEQLDGNQSVWDYIQAFGTDERTGRDTLALFLFRGDDILQQVSSLSGGEKARLLLCSLVLRSANFLVLDEPNNHLDLDTQQILLRALQEFPGTVLFSTHDRYLLEQLASRVVLLEKNGETNAATAKVYFGDYEYFLWKREQEKQEEQSDAKQNAKQNQGAAPKNQNAPNIKKPAAKTPYQLEREKRAAQRKLEREEATLLESIAKLEVEIEQTRHSFALEEIYAQPERLKGQKQKLAQQENALEQQQMRWEETATALEQSEKST